MDVNGNPDIGDIAKAAEAATGVVGAMQRLFPGLSQRSLDRAESAATKRLLKDVKLIQEKGTEIGLCEDTIREFADDAFRRHGKRKRFEKVVSFAAEGITNTENASNVDPEWAYDFQNYAESSYDEEVQRLWGAILAGEVNCPGSFSKRTMSTLKGMSKKEAQAFRMICGYSTRINVVEEIEDQSYQPILVLVNDDEGLTFNCGSISYSDLSTLDAIGLIDTSLIINVPFERGESRPFIAHSEVVIAGYDGEKDSVKVPFENAVFRPSGIELSRICGIGFAENLGDILSKKFADSGLSTKRVPL